MSRLATLGLVLSICTLTLFAQSVGPDVIVGDLIDIDNYGSVGGIYAFAVGTESCNIGNVNLTWDVNTNLHPVISQNMYRLKNGRFEQLGQSWLKHGFFALSLQLCGNCPIPSGGASLNVGCSDPYSAQLNGSQGNGPKNEVNAATGLFPFPYGLYPPAPATIGRRLQVAAADLNPATNAGARYFVEGHYVHREDALANNKNNNASYREVVVGDFNFVSFLAPLANPNTPGGTQQQKPGLQAWKDVDPDVQIFNIDVPNDGRFIVAFKGIPLAGEMYRYEYAVQNLNSDRSMGSFSVEMWPGANPVNMGMRNPPYHSSEPYSNASWTPVFTPGVTTPGSLTWSTTPYTSNQNASALRWANMYNFWFESDQLPGNVTLGLFKPGSPTTMAVPAFCPPKRPPPGTQPPYTVVTSAPYDFVNIAGGSLGPVGDDAQSPPINLPFSFPYYGNSFNQVVISTNGYLTFPGQDGTQSLNLALPNAGNPHGMIAGYWDNLTHPSVGNIRYQTVNNRFVVYWNGTHVGSALPLQFEVILEPTGAIVSTMVTVPVSIGGNSATRGIESWNNTEGLTLSHNVPNSAFSNTTARYEPNTTVPVSANLFTSGSLAGGNFRVVFVSQPNSAVITMASAFPGPTNLGVYGVIPLDLSTAIGVFDYPGILTGFPNPFAITGGPCGNNMDVTFWIAPGSIPPGVTLYHGAIGVPLNPGYIPPNGSFDIANPSVVQS